MNRFEALKANTIQISLHEMLRGRVDEDIVAELIFADESLKDQPILSKILTTKKDLQELKAFFLNIKDKIPARLYADCMDDFREIKDDVQWINSPDGKIVLAIEDWVIRMREKLNSELKEYRIFVGRSFVDPKQLIVGGIIKDESELTAIKAIIEKEKPPVDPNYRFEQEP